MTSIVEMKSLAADLFANDPYYADRGKSWIETDIFPAIENDKYIAVIKSKKLSAFVSYAFLTEQEVLENNFNTSVVFKRKSGDVLHVCQFICREGKRSVYSFVKHIHKSLSKKYPTALIATSKRKRNGTERPQLWFRKDAL